MHEFPWKLAFPHLSQSVLFRQIMGFSHSHSHSISLGSARRGELWARNFAPFAARSINRTGNSSQASSSRRMRAQQPYTNNTCEFFPWFLPKPHFYVAPSHQGHDWSFLTPQKCVQLYRKLMFSPLGSKGQKQLSARLSKVGKNILGRVPYDNDVWFPEIYRRLQDPFSIKKFIVRCRSFAFRSRPWIDCFSCVVCVFLSPAIFLHSAVISGP